VVGADRQHIAHPALPDAAAQLTAIVPCYVRLQELTGPSTASSVIIPIPNPDLGMDQFAVQSGEPVIHLLRPERLGIKGYGGSRPPSHKAGVTL
jgi:hypothetical protein